QDLEVASLCHQRRPGVAGAMAGVVGGVGAGLVVARALPGRERVADRQKAMTARQVAGRDDLGSATRDRDFREVAVAAVECRAGACGVLVAELAAGRARRLGGRAEDAHDAVGGSPLPRPGVPPFGLGAVAACWQLGDADAGAGLVGHALPWRAAVVGVVLQGVAGAEARYDVAGAR